MQAAIAFTLLACSHLLPAYNLVEIRESDSDEFNEINNVIVDSFYDSFFNMVDDGKAKNPTQKTMFLETYPESGEVLEQVFPGFRIPERDRGASIVHKLTPKRPATAPIPNGQQDKREKTSTNINATTTNNGTAQKNPPEHTFLDTISALNFMTNSMTEKKATSNGGNNENVDNAIFDSHKKYPFLTDDYGATDFGNDPILVPCGECMRPLYPDHKCTCADPVNEAAFYRPLNEEILSFQDMETPLYHNDRAKLTYRNNPKDNVLNFKLNLQIELPNNMDHMKVMEAYIPSFLAAIPPSDIRPTLRHNHEKHRSKDTAENRLFRTSYNTPSSGIEIPFSPLFDTFPRKEMTKMKAKKRNPASGKSANSKKKVTRARVKTAKKKAPNQINSASIEKPKRMQRVYLNVTANSATEKRVETTSRNYVDQTTPQSVFQMTAANENEFNFIIPAALEAQTTTNETEVFSVTQAVTENTINDTENTPSDTENTPYVTENTPNGTENTPYVTESTPNGTANTSTVTENTSTVTENTPNGTDNTPNGTENTINDTENTPNSTETPPRRKRSISEDSGKINKRYILSNYVDPNINLNIGMTAYPPVDQVESNLKIEDNSAYVEQRKLHLTAEAKSESENELLHWPEFRIARNYDFEVSNITSLMEQRENNRVVNVSEDTIRRNHMKALEQAVFGEVDWTDMDTVVPAFMSFVGKYLHGVISFCSDSICHSMKCKQQTCVHRLCLPHQRSNNIGHCDLALGAESIAPMTTTMDLPSKSVFEIMEIMKEKMKRKVYGKVTLCITGKCMSFVYTRKFFSKAKCSASNLDVSGHCPGTISDKRETVDVL